MGIDVRTPGIGAVQPRYAAQGLLTNKLSTPIVPESGQSVPFAQFFNEAVSNVAGSDYVDKISNIGLMAGTLDNLHTATIAAEKADIMLNLTVQVRNKLVESYQEIMRMQM
ncbi:MAG: flagellar hook-basal body complex protein FliE [Oscillospiraceae bacterium]|nr:flagellar hook-basal body complex protein FliE [Oscillospiraceae bacterium]